MSALNPELFLRDELEFELRARGKDPRGNVQILRRQLREALAAGDALSKVTIPDQESEWEICSEKWEELRELASCVESLEAGPGCSIGVRRIRQCLQHVILRLQNLQAQGGELVPPYNICLLYTSRCV